MPESKTEFYNVIEECREVFRETIPNFKRKGGDFDSVIYAEGLRNDFGIIKKYLGEKSRLVADLGCGKGYISVLLRRSGYSVIGLDIPEPVGEFGALSERLWQLSSWRRFAEQFEVNYSLADVQRLPLKSGVFDGVLMYAVVEHISLSAVDVQKTLADIYRTLKPGGFLFIFRCPRADSYAEKLAYYLGLPRHDKLYSEKELKKLLGEKFSILEFKRTDMILAFVPRLYLWNRLSPFLLVLDKILLKSPLSKFSHHMLLVCRKEGT